MCYLCVDGIQGVVPVNISLDQDVLSGGWIYLDWMTLLSYPSRLPSI